MTAPVPISDAMKDPTEMAVLQTMIGLMRMGLAGMANVAADAEDGAELAMFQSRTITCCALLAGMTAGHMLTFGVMSEQDKRKAGQVVLINFRNGVKFGRGEGERAMLAQATPEGRA